MLSSISHDDVPALIDRLYEAAFLPELWPGVLDDLAGLSRSHAGTMFVFDGIRPIRFRATELVHEITERFCSSGQWMDSGRIPYYHRHPFTGFIIAQDYYPPEFLAADVPFQNKRKLGLKGEMGTIIPMPGGELAVYVFGRREAEGPYVKSDIEVLDVLHPHMARAGLIAARLGMERAEAMVSALAALGLPAAVMTVAGRVLAVNALLEDMPRLFLPAAFGGLAIADERANQLLQEAVAASRSDREPLVRSIPVAAREGTPPVILHVVPLRRAAHDIFSGADILVAATVVSATALVPTPGILTGLFDLTPAEARLASALVAGRTLKEAAAECGITVKSSRGYLARVLHKTGTGQQSQLVALLKGAGPLGSALNAQR